MKEYGDKVPADKKSAIESALEELKEAHKAQDLAKIETATAKLNEVWQAASQEMYQGAGGAQGQNSNAGAGASNGANNQGGNSDDEVTDVDYEEVSE